MDSDWDMLDDEEDDYAKIDNTGMDSGNHLKLDPATETMKTEEKFTNQTTTSSIFATTTSATSHATASPTVHNISSHNNHYNQEIAQLSGQQRTTSNTLDPYEHVQSAGAAAATACEEIPDIILADFQNVCTTPRESPTDFSHLVTNAPPPRLTTAAPPPRLTTAARPPPPPQQASFPMNRNNAMLVATLAVSSFNLGALVAFLVIQFQGRRKKRTLKRFDEAGTAQVKQWQRMFRGYSSRREQQMHRNRGNNFVLSKLEHLDPCREEALAPEDDHAVNDLRKEIKRLLLGKRARL